MPLKISEKWLTTQKFHSIIDYYTENGVDCAFLDQL